MRTVQTWTCELGYGADTMFHRTYFLLLLLLLLLKKHLNKTFKIPPQCRVTFTIMMTISNILFNRSIKPSHKAGLYLLLYGTREYKGQ